MSENLRTVAALGGFFATVADPTGPGWEAFPGDVEARADRLAARFPPGVDRRACASTDVLALTARVVAPALACAVRTGTVPVLTSDALSVEVATGVLGVASAVPDRPAGELVEAVVQTACADLVAAYRRPFRLPERVLWGNVASALAGAATVLGGPEAIAVVRTAVGSGPLAGTGYYESVERFRRRSCCLYYRLPGGGLCGDCVLAGA